MDSEYLKMHEFSKNRSNTDPWTLYQAITKPRTRFERSSIGITHATIYLQITLFEPSLSILQTWVLKWGFKKCGL